LCFYIYAPNQIIQIPRIYEFVYLNKNGSSTVTTDCLVESTSDIQSLLILYPNRLYRIDEQGYPSGSSKVSYENNSYQLLDVDAPENYVYVSCGVSIKDPILQSAKDLGFKEFSFPDPEQRENYISGFVDPSGLDKLSLFPRFSDPMLTGLLYDMNYTILKYEFHIPVSRNLPRWIRLRFKGERTAKTAKFGGYVRRRMITNSLTYRYQITGPDDVKQYFIYLLRSGRLTVKSRFENGFDGLKDLFISNGLLDDQYLLHTTAKTCFGKVAINVHPRELEEFRLVTRPTGPITEIGYPDTTIRGHNYFDVYRWLATSEPGHEDTLSFSFQFQAKPVYLPFLFIPLAALAIALTSFCTNMIQVVLRYIGLLE
jgi:hypothetical protein